MLKKILIVEDEAVIALNTARVIAGYGYETQTVFTGEAAISLVNEDPDISLILMDIDLGRGMDGTVAAEKILDNHEIPIVFLSSHAEKDMVDRVRGITRYGYVLKSSGEFVLMESIHMAFELFDALYKAEEREDLFRYIIENDPNAIAVFDDYLRYMYASRRYLKGYRVQLQDIIGKHHYEVFPEIPEKWRKIHQRVLCGEILNNYNEKFNRLDGSVDYIRWECRPWYKKDGSVGGMVLYSDVLNETETFEESIVREKQYQKLFEFAPVGIFLTSSSGKALEANRKMASILEAASPQKAVAFFSDMRSKLYVDSERRHELLRHLREHQGVDDFEIRIRTMKGNVRWISINAKSRDIRPDGSFLINGTAQDITLVKEAGQRLMKDRQYLSTILHTSLDGFLVLDMDGRVIDVNQAYLSMSGYTREGFLGKSIYEIDTESREATREQLEQIAHNGSGQFQTDHRRHDGSIFTVDISVSCINSDGGRLVCFCRDVTDQLKSENTMNALNRELQQTLKEREFLVREINHRVKNNLQMIGSLISLKESSSKTDLADIKGQIDAIRIVHEMLYQSSDLRSISFRDYCTDLLTNIFSGFAGREVSVRNTMDEVRFPSSTAIPLGLIVNEIATNSMKYGFIHTAEALFSIDLSPDTEEGGYLFCLENNGEPFPETIDLDNPETLGLRLIVALTDQIGGSLSLRKFPSPRFCIRIPEAPVME